MGKTGKIFGYIWLGIFSVLFIFFLMSSWADIQVMIDQVMDFAQKAGIISTSVTIILYFPRRAYMSVVKKKSQFRTEYEVGKAVLSGAMALDMKSEVAQACQSLHLHASNVAQVSKVEKKYGKVVRKRRVRGKVDALAGAIAHYSLVLLKDNLALDNQDKLKIARKTHQKLQDSIATHVQVGTAKTRDLKSRRRKKVEKKKKKKLNKIKDALTDTFERLGS